MLCQNQVHKLTLIPKQTRKVTLLSGPHPLSGTVLRQADFDETIGQCLVSDRTLACIFLIRKGDNLLKGNQSYLLPQHLHTLSHCRTSEPNSGSGLNQAIDG